MGEVEEAGVADADGVAVVEGSAQDGHSIDEGAASAVEVDQFILAVLALVVLAVDRLDGAVASRDRWIGEA
ncbi:hypothetical protein RBB78_18835 [Tunturiibacter empetritectus]